LFSRQAAERQMNLNDTEKANTILGKIFTAVDPETGTKFALENIRAHADEFMYVLYLSPSY
jgi:hypothetical protein